MPVTNLMLPDDSLEEQNDLAPEMPVNLIQINSASLGNVGHSGTNSEL